MPPKPLFAGSSAMPNPPFLAPLFCLRPLGNLPTTLSLAVDHSLFSFFPLLLFCLPLPSWQCPGHAQHRLSCRPWSWVGWWRPFHFLEIDSSKTRSVKLLQSGEKEGFAEELQKSENTEIYSRSHFLKRPRTLECLRNNKELSPKGPALLLRSRKYLC